MSFFLFSFCGDILGGLFGEFIGTVLFFFLLLFFFPEVMIPRLYRPELAGRIV